MQCTRCIFHQWNIGTIRTRLFCHAVEVSERKDISTNNKRKSKSIDFKRFKRRHIALKILYLGWAYSGFADQANTDMTIEGHLFSALRKYKLIEFERPLNYHHCSRTDKEVSALAQVVTLDVRTNLLEGKGVITPEDYIPRKVKGMQEDINFCFLNRALPKDIKILSWAPVDLDFAARYGCSRKTYKYYFPKGNLDIEKMQEASQYLIGEHDFRNMCKINIKDQRDFIRNIFSVSINPLSGSEGFQICELVIVGKSFLWKQVRYIASLLILIGQGKESPQLILDLLDVVKTPKRPAYVPTLGYPLILFETEYENIDWQINKDRLKNILYALDKFRIKHAILNSMIKEVINEINSKYDVEKLDYCLSQNVFDAKFGWKYRPVMELESCGSKEERLQRRQEKNEKRISTEETIDIL